MPKLVRLLFAMATATPKPRLFSAALPTSGYTHGSSIVKKRCAQPIEASNPISGDVASRFRSTGPDAFNRF
jgi:hypothetical protein